MRTILIIIFVLNQLVVYSQSMSLLYDFNKTESASFLNPATQISYYKSKKYKYYFDMGLDIRMEDLQLSYAINSTLDKFFSKLTKESHFFMNFVNSNNLAYIYDKNNHYTMKWTFGFYFNLSAYLLNSDGLLDFFSKGNYNIKTGDKINLDLYGDGFLSTVYNVSWFYKPTMSNWSYGLRLKIYNNIINYKLKSNGYLYHESDKNNLFKISYKYGINFYYNNYNDYTDIFWSGNYGLGLDLGVNYVGDRYRFAFSIVDINLQWSSRRLSEYSIKDTIEYNGVDISKTNQSNIFEKIRYTLSSERLKNKTKEDSYTSSIPYKFFISGIYYLSNNRKSNIGFQINSVFLRQRFINIFRGFYGLNFSNYYDLRLIYSLSRYNYRDIGFLFNISKPWGLDNLFISASNVLDLFDIKTANTFSFHFGGSIYF